MIHDLIKRRIKTIKYDVKYLIRINKRRNYHLEDDCFGFGIDVYHDELGISQIHLRIGPHWWIWAF